MKKRPRGMFTVTGRKGWDERIDLKLSMREQFLVAVNAFNSAVFSNGQQNRAFNSDVFDLQPDLADLVYIDTPYISPFSDCDYTRRYHFVEGYCRYWKGVEITFLDSLQQGDSQLGMLRDLFQRYALTPAE